MRSYFVNISPEATVINLFAILRGFLVDLGTLELCGSRDYFASSLLVKKTYRLNLIVTLKRESCCL